MINVIIVDDEKASREALSGLLSESSDVHLLKTCSGPIEGIEAISSLKPDLVFLDVEMPGISGLEMLQKFPSISFDVIFSTAYEKYAIQAIKASALDYILKPVGEQELEEALNKYRKKIVNGMVGRQVEVLLQNYGSKNKEELKTLALPSSNGLEFINTEDIIRLQSDNNYTIFHLKDNRKITVSRTLKDYEDILSRNGFCRIHQSHIINLRHLKKYTRGEGGYVTMTDSSQVDVSRLRKDDFLESVKEWR